MDELDHLRPWPSILSGSVLPDERVNMDTPWTTVYCDSRPPRLVEKLNHDWTFNYFPDEKFNVNFTRPDFDDQLWPALSLPHTWQTFETTREAHPFIASASSRDSTYWWNGWGVYRKRFVLPNLKAISGKQMFIEFDGVMKYCRVWLNGHEIGDHKGGYASFSFVLTKYLSDGTNVLCVAVNARQNDAFRTPPMTAGNFDVYGGIYRDVRLVVKSAVHIPFQGSATHEGGTFITTPEVNSQQATIRVRTWVKNDSTKPCTVVLRTAVMNPSGRKVTQQEARADVDAGVFYQFDQSGLVVSKPRLWSPETPILYRVKSEVLVNGTVVDRYESPFGFRWFEWNKLENRLYLNGKPLNLHGTNPHQDFPWLGDAVPKWIHVRDMAEIRFGLGDNFMRTAHYSQDPLIYDLADRYGLLVCEEVPDIKNIDFNPAVQRQQVLEMIRRDRNHPSIVMWSMGNETTHPADSAWAHVEDDTRLIYERHVDLERAGKFITLTDKEMEMENLLRCTVRGWTDRDVAPFEPKNNQHTGTEEWEHKQAMIEGGCQRGHIGMTNCIMFCYADHGANRVYANAPLKYINPKGIVDLYRIPKYIYYLWQANYLKTPMVFIHPEYWRSQYAGKKRDIIVDSNCERVELKVNGRSMGVMAPSSTNDWNVTFKSVPIKKGALTVEGVKDGHHVTSQLSMAGPPARLTLAASPQTIPASRDSVVLVTANVVDANGIPVQGFSRDLHWEVHGPARLVAPELYQSDIKDNLETNGVFYIVTPVCTGVRATGEPGEITVGVKADGVAPAVLKLKAKAVKPLPGFVFQPPLSDERRQPVKTAIVASATGQSVLQNETISGTCPLMKPAREDIVLPGGRDAAFYKQAMLKWYSQNDPSVMKQPAFAELLEVFVTHFVRNDGLLVADDYNNVAQQFNDVELLNAAIIAEHLPANSVAALVYNYARRIIFNEEPMRIADEQDWIRSLSGQTNVETVMKTVSASQIFEQWYPGLESAQTGQRDRAFIRFKEINRLFGTPLFDGKPRQTIHYPANSALFRPTMEQLIEQPESIKPARFR